MHHTLPAEKNASNDFQGAQTLDFTLLFFAQDARILRHESMESILAVARNNLVRRSGWQSDDFGLVSRRCLGLKMSDGIDQGQHLSQGIYGIEVLP